MPRSRTSTVLALTFALLGTASGIAAASPASAVTDTITIVSAGSPAANVPTITLTPLSATVSYDNPTVTLSGQVTTQAPDGTVTPYANSTVTMASSMKPDVTLPTDLNGKFSTTVTPLNVNGDWAVIEVGPTATVAYGQSPRADFTLKVDPVQLTASLSAKTITYGAQETLSGTVTYTPTGTTTKMPLTSQTVDVYDSKTPQTPAVTGRTDGNGNFSITLPNTTGTTWTVAAGGSVQNGNPYLSTATVPLPESVNLPTAITSFHTTLNQYWQVSFSGCLGLTEPIPGAYVTNTSGLTIQYSPWPNGPWRTLSRGYQLGNACGAHGRSFSGKTTAKINYAYYRAYYPGTTAAATPSTPKYLSSASGQVLAWKYADRITAFSVSPTVVPKGGKLTARGQLQYYYRGWRNFGGQQVLIILSLNGKGGPWYWLVKVRTNSTGHFSATFKDPVSATWSAEYEGNSTHLAAGAATIYVRLKG